MEVIANGQKIPFILTEEKNLSELIVTLLLLSSKADKIIVECNVNGEAISLDEREKYTDRPIEGIEKIELCVANKSEWAIETLREIENGYPQFITDLTEISNCLLAGQKHKALTLFSQCLNSWRRVINFLNLIENAFNLQFANIQVNGKTVDNATKELYTLLNDIKNAIQNDDTVTIGDLIEYELKQKIEEQKKIVNELQHVIQRKTDKLKQQVQ